MAGLGAEHLNVLRWKTRLAEAVGQRIGQRRRVPMLARRVSLNHLPQDFTGQGLGRLLRWGGAADEDCQNRCALRHK